MVTLMEAPVNPTHRVDGIGGVRCKGCDEPFFKVAPGPNDQNPQGVIFLRHKACGTYNVVDLALLRYS
jgi:hypothetical protein